MKNKKSRPISISMEENKYYQFEFLKYHAISILEKVLNHLKNNQFNDIEKMIKNSPDGDGWGTDKYFIDFKFNNDDDGNDIAELIDTLKNLKGEK